MKKKKNSKDTRNYNPNLIAKPVRMTIEDYNSSTKLKKMSEEEFFNNLFLTEAPILIENFCELFGLKDAIFDLKTLEKQYGKFAVDSISQKSSKFVEEIGFDLNNDE